MGRLFRIWVLAAFCVLISFTACKGDWEEIDPGVPASTVAVEGEEDEVTELLKKAPGLVRIRREVRSQDVAVLPGVPVYYAYFNQLVDHNDPSRGTFEQKVAIIMDYPYKAGENLLNILHTQGYYTPDKADELRPTRLRLGRINEVHVEYRYFGTSLPEPFDNLEFNYLSSEQYSADLHAIMSALKQTGLFPGKWISTGISKNGIATALYAYYDELNGWNDIDVYVPFCAPFLTSLDDTSLGDYIEQGAMADMPELRQRIFDIGRLAAADTQAGAELRRQLFADYPEPDSEETQLHEIMFTFMSNLFGRFSYYYIDTWMNLVPDPYAGNPDYEKLSFFMLADDTEFAKAIDAQKEKVATRTVFSDERREELMKLREDIPIWPYYVQAVLELGTYEFGYGFLEGCSVIDRQDMLRWAKDNTNTIVDYPEYVPRYNGKMMKDFLRNLNTTGKKMVFVYGANDPWTGAAIPDSATDNPNIRKMIIPWGSHDDEILSGRNWENKGREIVEAINAFLGR